MPSDERESDNNEADDPYNQLDFSSLSFPSDGLTIGSLRRIFPERFDQGLSRDGDLQPHFFPHATEKPRYALHSDEGLLGAMLFSERLIAAYAYGKAQGLPELEDWEGEVGLRHFKENLTDDYVRLGLAGKQQAAELIRDIERQATEMNRRIGR